MSQPIIVSLDPTLLRKNAWNTNIVTAENDAKLEESIKRNGLFKPVIVREVGSDLEIIGGEHRWEVALRLGLNPIMVVNMGVLSDVKAKEISVIDNSRYGDDDILAFAELLKEIGSNDDLQNFLPYADTDLASIFSSSDIALDDLGLDNSFGGPDTGELEEPPAARAPKTHTIQRFKTSLGDAEMITKLIATTMKNQGFTASDDLTNAGDALVFLLSTQFKTQPSPDQFELDDIELDAMIEDLQA